MIATFKTGAPVFGDHSVASNGTLLPGGSVVMSGNAPLITHSTCPPGHTVGLALGGGVYLCPKATGAGSGGLKGAKAYYHTGNDNTSALLNATAYKHIGYFAATCVDADTECLIRHAPENVQGS